MCLFLFSFHFLNPIFYFAFMACGGRQGNCGNNMTFILIFNFLDECLHSRKLISIIGSNLQGGMNAMQ